MKEELIGKPVAEVIAKRSLPKLVEGRERILEEGVIRNQELIGLKRDGSEFPVLVNVTLIKDSAGKPTGRIFTVRDITERKKAEEMLQEREKLLNNILSASPIGIGVVEIGPGGVGDRKLGWTNQNMMEMFGFEPHEDHYIGQSASVIYASKEEYERVSQILKENLEKGKIAEVDAKLKRKDGSIFDSHITMSFIDPSDPAKGAVATISDISWRKHAEEKLRASEKQLRETKDYLDDIIKSSADAIVVVNMEGIVRDWNRGAEDYMGYTADEVIGTPNRNFFADAKEADRIMERVRREGEIKNYRTIVLRKDGKPVHISMSAALLKDKDGMPIGTVRVSRDITKEVELEERIKKERDNLNLIFESMADGVYIVSKDYEIEFMNKVLIDEFGDRLGSICYKAFHNREEPCPLCKHSKVMKGKSVRWEWHSRRMNKTYDLIETPLRNVDGAISKLTIFRDITERKRMEEELRESEEELQYLINNTWDIIFHIDLEGNYTFANKAAERITGYPVDKLLRMNMRELIAPEYQQFVFGRLKKRIAGEPLKQPFDIEIMHKDGHRVILEITTTRIRDRNGKLIGVQGIARDITERKKAEEEREQLLKELEAKNTEMEGFTYTVSHDLRSPLVTILGFVNMLQKDLERNEKEKVESDLKYIKTAATKMDHLLSDTLELSRIGRVANPPEDVPFGELVQEAMGQTAEQIKSNGVEISVAEDFPTVHVDHVRTIQVLVNLIVNSINYMGEQSNPKIDIGYRVDGNETVFFVKDNGIGIDPSQHEKVCELFYKVDNSSEGTGVGLAIVKRIIEVHGGRIWIESEKGEGCTVCFTLPVYRNTFSTRIRG